MARTAALAKYFNALSKSLQDDGSRPSLKRRRLHLLYVLNDVLYQVVMRSGNIMFATAWDKVLPGLIASAAAFDNSPKHKEKIADLIRLWDEQAYVNSDVIRKLEEALASGVAPQHAEETQVSNTAFKLSKDAPFTLPSFHGDQSVPWYDLPAATWLPHLTPNSTKPMFPDQIRPIQLAPGTADKILVDAVQNLLGDVERMFSKEQKWNHDPTCDLNELGERVVLDEITGEIVGGETYYGWSRHAATRADDHGVLRDQQIKGQEFRETPEDEAFLAVKAGLTAVAVMGVPIDDAVPVTVEAGAVAVVINTVVQEGGPTADHYPARLHPSTAETPRLVQIHHLPFLNRCLQLTSLLCHRPGISSWFRLHQLAIRAPGHHHRLIHTWLRTGFLPIQP
ncbi:hypothetical protein ACHAPU_008968 [Fusarium lateritium]